MESLVRNFFSVCVLAYYTIIMDQSVCASSKYQALPREVRYKAK